MGRYIGEEQRVGDAYGVGWRVRELEVGDEWPARRGDRCLVFENDFMIWRLWAFPADWRALSGEQLAELGWRTQGTGDAG